MLEFLKLLLGLVDDFLYFRVNHHLLHLEAHLGLEAEAAEFALGLANGELVVFDLGCGLVSLGHRCCTARLVARLVQKLHDFTLARQLHSEVMVGVELIEQVH